MHKALSRTLWGVAFVGGLTVLGAGAANAADTSGEDGIASGNQVAILGELPVTASGNAISILGDSESSNSPATPAAAGDSTPATAKTSGEDGIASGNQVMPEATLPVTVTGNNISIIGDSSTAGTQPNTAPSDSADTTAPTTTGEDGIASGNQLMPEVRAPLVLGGNDVSIIRGETVLDGGLLVSEPRMTEATAAGAAVSGPAVRSPRIGALELGVMTPTVSEAVAGDSSAVEAAPSGSPTPLLATAALAPAVTAMLAATGVEALPLLGGIALMLCTGLALVVATRMTHGIS